MASQTKEMASKLDLVGAVIALVVGILLLIGTLGLDEVVGIILIVVGLLALVRAL